MQRLFLPLVGVRDRVKQSDYLMFSSVPNVLHLNTVGLFAKVNIQIILKYFQAD